MIYHGNGGFTHTDLYNMPIYLRNFYYKKLLDTKKEEQKQSEKATNKVKSQGISRPSIPRK